MNYIWALMLLAGIGFSAANGEFSTFTEGLMDSSTNAIYFVLGLAGIMATWAGLMNIAKQSGLLDAFARLMRPFMGFLFPTERNKDTLAMMLMSFTANLFGAGNSATVFALKSMVMLDEENQHRETASNVMCMFIAVNMTMVQLVPITIIKIRSDTGSADPGSIILPSIVVGFVAMAASIAVCKFYERRGAAIERP